MITVIFSLKWFHLLEGVECSKPIKNHLILQYNLKHKKGFHITAVKCKGTLKWNSGELVVFLNVCFTESHSVTPKGCKNLQWIQFLSLYLSSHLSFLHFTSWKQKPCVFLRKEKSSVIIGGGLQWPGQVAGLDCIRLMMCLKCQRKRKRRGSVSCHLPVVQQKKRGKTLKCVRYRKVCI